MGKTTENKTTKVTSTNFEDYKSNKKLIDNNPKVKLIQEIFSFDAGGWKAPLPKYSDKQTIEYKIVK